MEKAKNSSGFAIRTFGRTRRRALSPRQQFLFDNILPLIAPMDEKWDEKNAILEIGFGTGEHIVELALAHPEKIIIGAEPFVNGVASLLSAITDEAGKIKPEYKNIRIWPDDVRKLLSNVKSKFSAIYVLHPDPWPKARHEKRRLLSAEFLKTLGSFVSKDGSIIIGTDHADYYDWILEQVPRAGLGIKSENLGTIETKYQKKNMFGSRETMYLSLFSKP